MFGAGFLGWGKPVNTNPFRLRGGLYGLAVVSLAGPASNVVFAFILAGVAVLVAGLVPALAQFAAQGVRLSLYLAIFNMIPVPPLDGSKLLLVARVPAFLYRELARAGFLVLLVLLTATGLGRWMSAWSYEAAVRIFGIFANR